MRVLVVNAGSSSLKLSVIEDGDKLAAAQELEAAAGPVDQKPVEEFVAHNGPIDAVGHRVVHGGTEFTTPVRVDAGVVRRLELLSDLAPLHQPKSLMGLKLVSKILVDVPVVACFDTAFHATIPAVAATYALPSEWRRRWDLRRFGFHGLSHSYASRRAGEMLLENNSGTRGTVATREPAGVSHGPGAGQEAGAAQAAPPARSSQVGSASGSPSRVVTCHLGSGASLAAVRGGVSVDTTMGFTPLEGLVMATRSGDVDPGLLLWLEEHVGMPPSELASTLEHRSGLLGLTGTADMRAVLAAEQAGDEDAALGMGVYLHRLRAGIASMAAAMEGVDTIVFTGGVGERSAPVRQRASDGLRFLGVELDETLNAAVEPDREIGSPGAGVRAFVIAAREDLEIARGVRQVLAGRTD
jgi:acetate kinase